MNNPATLSVGKRNSLYYLLALPFVSSNWINGDELWVDGELYSFSGMDFGLYAANIAFLLTLLLITYSLFQGLAGLLIKHTIGSEAKAIHQGCPSWVLIIILFNYHHTELYNSSDGSTIIEKIGYGGNHSIYLLLSVFVLLRTVIAFWHISSLDTKTR